MKVLILYSGGADSRLLLELARYQGFTPYCVLIDYEQAHLEELVVARTILGKLKVSYHTVSLQYLEVNSALTGDGTRGGYEGVSEWYVPSRNMIFVAIAASVAESLGISTIWYGADWSDFDDRFPDCTQEWVGRMNELLAINSSYPITLEAPLLGIRKESVRSILKVVGVSETEYFSGYGENNETNG